MRNAARLEVRAKALKSNGKSNSTLSCTECLAMLLDDSTCIPG